MFVTTDGRTMHAAMGPDRFHLYIASDDVKTVVALLAPLVAGTSEYTTNAATTTITPRPVRRPAYPNGPVETLPAAVLLGTPRSSGATIAGLGALVGAAIAGGLTFVTRPWIGLPVGAVAAAVGGGQAIRRQLRTDRGWTRGHRVLAHYADRHTFRQASSAARRTLGLWPELRARVNLDDPSPTLARSLWDLAGVLVQRGTVRETHAELVQAIRGVPADTSVYVEVAARLGQVAETLQRLEADVERRLEYLVRLAEEADLFVRQQQALAQARAVVRNADEVMGALTTGDPQTDVAAAELAEHTAAVLAAYRELTNQFGDKP